MVLQTPQELVEGGFKLSCQVMFRLPHSLIQVFGCSLWNGISLDGTARMSGHLREGQAQANYPRVEIQPDARLALSKGPPKTHRRAETPAHANHGTEQECAGPSCVDVGLVSDALPLPLADGLQKSNGLADSNAAFFSGRSDINTVSIPSRRPLEAKSLPSNEL